MALKVLMLKRKIDIAQKQLDNLRSKDSDFEKRESEIEASIEEAVSEEERTAVDEAVATFETEKAEHETAKKALEDEIRGLETELEAEESKQNVVPAETPTDKTERKAVFIMENRTRFAAMSMEQRSAFVQRDDVAKWLSAVKAMKDQRSITNADLTIPEVVLPLLYEEAKLSSQLMQYVNVKNIRGTARQTIMGAIPEAVWTEMCASLNELDIDFASIEVDGYKVGGYFKICNALLADNDVNLASEIISVLGAAIGKAIDKAILFGTGVKMPLGIATRLAQTSQPADYPAKAPAWTDLHTTNILTLNLGATSGTGFFESLIMALGAVKKRGGANGNLFWAMNRKTHMAIMAKALAFNSAAALTAGVNGELPIIGGKIVEIETNDMQDYEIIGGYGDAYLLAQRQGATFGSSDQQFFTDDETVFKGSARYDGKPVFADAFIIVNFNNTAPTTSDTFPIDYANADLGTLTVTAAQGSATGKTVLTVSGTEASGTTLKYKVGDIELKVGQKLNATWSALTSGTTAITAAAGTVITVAEIDGSNKVIKRGDVISVPKT